MLSANSKQLLIATLGSAAAVGSAWLLYLSHSVSQHVHRSHGTRNRRSLTSVESREWSSHAQIPASVPQNVANEDAETILSYERIVSHPVPLARVTGNEAGPDMAELLTTYLRITMKAFTWTPQAFLLRILVPHQMKRTFEAKYIDDLDFHASSWVAGVYRVTHRGPLINSDGDQVTLALEAPEGYSGPPPPGGLIVARVEKVVHESGEAVVFANETWMWRNPDEQPTLLESSPSRWFHALVISWMVSKGVEAVTV